MEYANGDKYWYKNGELHREDGPAVELANGKKYWYLNGKRYEKNEFDIEMNNDLADDISDWYNDGGRAI